MTRAAGVSAQLGTRGELVAAARLRRQAAAAVVVSAVRALEQEPLFASADVEITALRASLKRAVEALTESIPSRAQLALDREAKAAASLHRLGDQMAARTGATRRQQLLERMRQQEELEVEGARERLEEGCLRAAPVLVGERTCGEGW